MSEIADKYSKKAYNAVECVSIEEYRNKQRTIKENFMNELICKHEVKNNPKARKCFELAWEHGHSSGFHEVENYFEEFVELIK